MSRPNLKVMTMVNAAAIALLLVPVAQAQEVSRGELLAAMCNTCHGTDGKGVKSIDPIAGEDAEDLYEDMKAFQSGEEDATIMGRHAEGYTDEELKLVAEYFAGLEGED